MWNSKQQNPIVDGVYIVFGNGSKFVAYWLGEMGWCDNNCEDIENIDHKVEYWFDLQFLANPFEATLTAIPAYVNAMCEAQPIQTLQTPIEFKLCQKCNVGMLITEVIYTCNCGISITEKLPLVTISS